MAELLVPLRAKSGRCCNGKNHLSKQGVSDCINEILTTEGMSGFYRGFGALIVQYALQFAIVRISTFSIRVSYLQIYAQVHATIQLNAAL